MQYPENPEDLANRNQADSVESLSHNGTDGGLEKLVLVLDIPVISTVVDYYYFYSSLSVDPHVFGLTWQP